MARIQLATPDKANISARVRAAAAVAYDPCVCPRKKNNGIAVTRNTPPYSASNQRKYFVNCGINKASDRASNRPTGGSAGRMYPGSLDLEIEKKSTQNKDQQQNSAGAETFRSFQSLRPPKYPANKSREVQGMKAITRTGA